MDENFISQQLVERLNLWLTETTNYRVVMSTGATMSGCRICNEVTLCLLDLTVEEDFLPLELGGVDVILEM